MKKNLTKTEIHPSIKKNNGPYIKVPLIFWFLIMIFYLCFYHQLWVKWVCIHIGNSSEHIGQTLYDSQNIYGCLTLNAMHIKVISLIIYLINDNLTNTSSTPSPAVKKTISCIAHLIILCTSTETLIY